MRISGTALRIAEEGAELNRQLDAACVAEGRDPNGDRAEVSPDVNMLESVQAFSDATEAYAAAGFGHMRLPWPRVEGEAPVLRAAASGCSSGQQLKWDRMCRRLEIGGCERSQLGSAIVARHSEQVGRDGFRAVFPGADRVA